MLLYYERVGGEAQCCVHQKQMDRMSGKENHQKPQRRYSSLLLNGLPSLLVRGHDSWSTRIGRNSLNPANTTYINIRYFIR
jgi:hypothetical protein